MTLNEFRKKWKDIPCGHQEEYPCKYGFDYEICNCGLDQLW